MFYLTMHSTHFIYGYMASDILLWLDILSTSEIWWICINVLIIFYLAIKQVTAL